MFSKIICEDKTRIRVTFNVFDFGMSWIVGLEGTIWTPNHSWSW